MKAKLHNCLDWSLYVRLKHRFEDIEIKVPLTPIAHYHAKKNYDLYPWIEIHATSPRLEALEDTIQLWRLVNNEEFTDKLLEAIQKVFDEYLECEDMEDEK